jgi:hypothetical protein
MSKKLIFSENVQRRHVSIVNTYENGLRSVCKHAYNIDLSPHNI